MIAILGHIRTDTPGKEPPKWIPGELVSSTPEDVLDRWDYITGKSKTLTIRERRFGVQMEMFKGTEAVKRKLSLGSDEDSPRPAKVARTFTSTPEELVKLCGAFVQATSAACDSLLTHVRMIDNLID